MAGVPKGTPVTQQNAENMKNGVFSSFLCPAKALCKIKVSKKSILKYRLVGSSTNYNLLEIELMTGRHHQIRCQLSKMGMPIKGDLKYGAERSNPDGGISLHAYYICFEHPVSHKQICVSAPLPDDNLWRSFTAQAQVLLPEGCL